MKLLGFVKQDKLSFSCHLADHCNLNCKGCDNFSCIAPKKDADISVFTKDFRRIEEIFGQKRISDIYLLGGEPLLNCRVVDFLKVSRSIFNNTDIHIHLVTNGILLTKMAESFWEAIKKYNITVEYTKYPIAYDTDSLEKIEKKFDVSVLEFGHDDASKKTLQFLPFDFSGKQDISYNYAHCFHANKCIQLREGKLYTCNIRAYIDIYCSKYGIHLETTPEDYINIYEDVTADDIFEFLSRPIPFCRYCNIKGRRNGHPWRSVGSHDSKYDWAKFELNSEGVAFLNRYKYVYFIAEENSLSLNIPNVNFKYEVITPKQMKDLYPAHKEKAVFVIHINDESTLYGIEKSLLKRINSLILYM